MMNLHTHCRYCDGKEEPEAYVQEALRQGFATLGFSSHAPVPFDNTFAIRDSVELKNYAAEVRRLQQVYADRIAIRLGLEIDYIPGVLDHFGPLTAEAGLDFTIGSVHLVNAEPGSTDLWFIDGPRQETYDEGLQRVFGGDVRRAVTAFWRQTCEMIERTRPTIVGHFDKVVMHNCGRWFSADEPWFRDLAMQTVSLIAELGLVAEVNTRGLYKGRHNDFYPSQSLLKEMNIRNIPVVVSTDAHHPSDLARFEGAFEMLKSIGYRNVVTQLWF